VSDEKKPMAVGGVAPTVFMKGGSTSAAYDKEMAKKRADAEARRAHQDRQMGLSQQSTTLGGPAEVARLGSHRMITNDSPRLLLRYLNRDKSVRQECISEITHIGGQAPGDVDTMFSLVCPKCLERGLPQGEAQLFVRNSHRKFHLDSRKAGPRVVDTPYGREVVLVCGDVTVDDIVRCSNFNCDWAVRIDNSNVQEA
jgi:hypothetical protein